MNEPLEDVDLFPGATRAGETGAVLLAAGLIALGALHVAQEGTERAEARGNAALMLGTIQWENRHANGVR